MSKSKPAGVRRWGNMPGGGRSPLRKFRAGVENISDELMFCDRQSARELMVDAWSELPGAGSGARGSRDNPKSGRWRNIGVKLFVLQSVDGSSGDYVRVYERSGTIRVMMLGDELQGKYTGQRLFVPVWVKQRPGDGRRVAPPGRGGSW